VSERVGLHGWIQEEFGVGFGHVQVPWLIVAPGHRPGSMGRMPCLAALTRAA
jgi:hypothetical protein